ncbi:MAG TPA: zf-HC2 domain-containing protein, partial [Gemmatimonadaceae bacterium]|nr:zf-HC2 domain-containing protein [Gemmatimonadaceae bacterium]
MTMPITCDVFEARLADWLEDALSADERAALEAHEAACAACGTLAGELREIRAAAAALPELPPSRDLWSGIAERIEPAVVPLDAARTMERRTAHRARRWGLAAAAAALVIASSGIGYGVAMRRAESRYQAALAERGSAGSAAPAVSAAPSRDSM